MENEKLYFIVAQRNQSGTYANIYVNGSDRRNILKKEAFLKMLDDNGRGDLKGDVLSTVFQTFSLYMIDLVNGRVGLLSAVRQDPEVSVQQVINMTPGMIDAENSQGNVSDLLNIGSDRPSVNEPKEDPVPRYGKRTKDNTRNNVFSEFLGNLSNFIR